MKTGMIYTMLLVLILAGIASADTEVKVGGEIRARTELDDRSFDPDNKLQKFTLLRTRLNITATKDKNATGFIQLQDSRMLGDMTQYGEWASGGTADGKNVDLHQAYIQLDKIWWEGFGGKLGRFEVNLGNQRVFGSVGWDNVGRSWEGAWHWYAKENWTLNGLVLKRTERNRSDGNADFDVYSLYYQNRTLGMDLFGIYEYDANAVDTMANGDNVAGVKRMSFGIYYQRTHKSMDYTFNAVLQTGTFGMSGSDIGQPVGDEYDVSAFLVAFEAGYSFENKTDNRLAIGIDYRSGDDNPSDNKIKAYSGLYPTAHKFNGYMDYFTSPNTNGLFDLYLASRCNFAEKWWGMLDFHYFNTAEDYSGLTELTKKLGMEFDLTVKTESVEGIGLVWGLSYFIPDDDFVGSTENDPGFWGYMQGTVGF